MKTIDGIPLVSMVGQADEDLLPHLLRHYRALGTTWFHLALHGAFHQDTHSMLSRQPDVTAYETPKVQFDDILKGNVLREILKGVESEWVIYVDADEFLELPTDTLAETMGLLQEFNMDALPAFMIQRLHPEGVLAPLTADSDIESLFCDYDFNLCERMGLRRPNWKTKFPIHRIGDKYLPDAGNHWPPNSGLNVHMPLRATVSHFKWRAAIFETFKLVRGVDTNTHEISAYHAAISQRRGRVPNEGALPYNRAALFARGFLVAPTTEQRENARYWTELSDHHISNSAPPPVVNKGETSDPAPQEADLELETVTSPRNLLGPVGRICFVTTRLAWLSPKGGLTTATSVLIERLAQFGHTVTVLYCTNKAPDDVSYRWAIYWAQREVNIVFHGYKRDDTGEPVHSNQVKSIATYLLAHPFDVVHFDDTFCFGCATAEIRAAGLGLENTSLITTTHGSGKWHRRGNNLPLGRNDVYVNWSLKKQLGLFDLVIHPSQYMKDYIDGMYHANANSAVIPNILSGWTRRFVATDTEPVNPDEIVFFGRIELRKGFDIFQDAISRIPRSVRDRITVTVIGLKGTHFETAQIRAFFKKQSIDLNFIGSFGAIDAVNYLRSKNCLVVIPSKIDNLPYTIYECLENDIPMICSDIGGIPELIDPADRDRIMIANDAGRAARFIEAAVINGVRPARLAFDPESAAIQQLTAFSWGINQARSRSRRRAQLNRSLSTLLLTDTELDGQNDLQDVLGGSGSRYDTVDLTRLAGADKIETLADRIVQHVRTSDADHILLWNDKVRPSTSANPVDAAVNLLENSHYGAVVFNFDALFSPPGYPLRLKVESVGAPGGPPEYSPSWNVYGAGVALIRRELLQGLDWMDVRADRIDFVIWQILNQLAARGVFIGSVPLPLVTRVIVSRDEFEHGTETDMLERLTRPWLTGIGDVQAEIIRKSIRSDFGSCPYAARIRQKIDAALQRDAEPEPSDEPGLLKRLFSR